MEPPGHHLHLAPRPPGRRSGRASGRRTGPSDTWSNVPVVEKAQPGRKFAFVRTARLGGTLRWRFRFLPSGGGTTVIESYEVVRPVPRILHLLVRLYEVPDLAADLRANMRASLRRLAEIAKREAPQPLLTSADEQRRP